ncbi:unnamed protein product [Darwinula stevensoni]|uniref:Uncharacterized protein n=1 Tax=Darwinula stevensoni TaxID=69355 RepID=A0A7R9A8S7_9CRUS|nr:unnamed protein product [Darwinula stevensoni]CAG0896690.1 unnamed protein product [Darwinula stevensoni]
MGAGDERPFKDAACEYVEMHCPEACTRAYSLPEGYILSKNKINILTGKARSDEEVDIPPEDLAVAEVFDKLKDALKDVPSLTVANYAFTDTLLKGINQQKKEKFMKRFGVTKEDLASGDHDVFGVGISGENILGLFFQIKATAGINPNSIIDMHIKATNQLQKDFNIFQTTCGTFLNSSVKLAGFTAFPMLSRLHLEKVIQCQDCRQRILTSEDLKSPESFRQFLNGQGIVVEKFLDGNHESEVTDTFQEIFTLYICAASAVDLPRNVTELIDKSEKQMKPMLVILTPQQKELVQRESKVTFICGGSGTGKTFVLKKKALMLAKKGEVLLINVAGGLLTEEFHVNFEGNRRIQVIDGREKGFEDDLEKFKRFLEEMGKEKHLLIDEVPLTLGFKSIISAENLSDHWKWVPESLRNLVLSVAISFRPNDQSYTRFIRLQDVKPGGCQIHILDKVKRNGRRISELFLAIGGYSRPTFVSRERTLRINTGMSGRGFLPNLFPLPSCLSLHPGKCKDEMVCCAVRVSYALRSMHEECFMSSKAMPLFVVVDDEMKKVALVNILTLFHQSLPVLFLDNNGDLRGRPVTDTSTPLFIVTEDEMMGCHLMNVIIVVDVFSSRWKNYNRVVATSGDNKILMIDEEDLTTGKFSHLLNEISGFNIMGFDMIETDSRKKLKILSRMAWEVFEEKGKINHLDKSAFPTAPLPEMDIDWDGREGEEEEDVANMLASCICGIFGNPTSGKSRRVAMLIERVMEQGGEVILLHSGGVLSWKLYRERWQDHVNVNVLHLDTSQVKSLQGIIDHPEVKETRRKTEEKEGMIPLFVVVEDSPLWRETNEEVRKISERLQALKMKLILAFKPHAKDTDISVESMMNAIQMNRDCHVMVLRSQATNMHLLTLIQENESPTVLNLEAKSLLTSALPGAPVLGLPVQYICYCCSGRHLGYACEGISSCEFIKDTIPGLSFLIQSSLGKIGDSKTTHILTSDEKLRKALKDYWDSNNYPKYLSEIRITHSADFRGCEASVIVSVNVRDEWILEVLSRPRTQLIIIDNIEEHLGLWTKMREEGRIQVKNHVFDGVGIRKILLQLDETEGFLKEPTWDDVGLRLGEEVLGKDDFLDENTGAIRSLCSNTWEDLNKVFPLPSDSSPLTDWGFLWYGEYEGGVSRIRGDERRKIIEILKQKGVKWEDEDYPPVVLRTERNGGGTLVSLSLSLTGSLFHFPLLKANVAADETVVHLHHVNGRVEENLEEK